MSTAPHTLGPWHVEPLQWDHGASIAIVAKGRIICTIAPDNEEDEPTMETAIRGPSDEANALLIAAAPELLKELRGARLMLYAWQGSRPPEYGPHPELERTIKAIETLIRKAEGRAA